MKMNPMRAIRIEKVTLNIGAGKDQTKLEKGMLLLKNITGINPVKTVTKKRIPNWGIRPGLPIGCKLTLRKQKAKEILLRLLDAKNNTLQEFQFDNKGNIAFGIHEYIDIPSANTIIINNAPVPIKNALLQPDWPPENPCAILAPPTKRSATPMKIDIIQLAYVGYAITSTENIRASIPSPIIVHLPPRRRKIPEIILSIPTTNKIIASIKTTATNVTAGNASA